MSADTARPFICITCAALFCPATKHDTFPGTHIRACRPPRFESVQSFTIYIVIVFYLWQEPLMLKSHNVWDPRPWPWRFFPPDRGIVACKDWRIGPFRLGFPPRRPFVLWPVEQISCQLETASNHQSFGFQLQALWWDGSRVRLQRCPQVWRSRVRLSPRPLGRSRGELATAPKLELLVEQRTGSAKSTQTPGWPVLWCRTRGTRGSMFGTWSIGILSRSLVGSQEPHASWAPGSCIRNFARDFATWV